jgi:uncharacterized repeat protein (TIGR03803 family)
MSDDQNSGGKSMRRKALVMAAVTLLLAASAWASSDSIVYSFNAYTGDGYYPEGGLIADSKGNLYGTTTYGGAGYGTVFELKHSTKGWTETLLHTFIAGVNDGAYPEQNSLVFDKAGNLYGASYQGGTFNYGTIFRLTLSGGKWNETILHNFAGYPHDGTYPVSTLVFDAAGHMYGTTYQGGSHNYGSAFQMTLTNGKWALKTIHSFPAGNGGDYPIGGLVVGKNGYFYGVTQYGGATFNAGTAYRLFQARGVWVSQVVYFFAGGAGGTNPFSGLTGDAAGNLFGTTYTGGNSNLGTVYELKAGANNKYSHIVLSSFKGGNTDGEYPYTAPLLLDSKGNIYGTTYQGGSQYNQGSVFKLTLSGGKYKESLIHPFQDVSNNDGANPRAGLTLVNGKLYGTTLYGGAHAAGTVFSVAP